MFRVIHQRPLQHRLHSCSVFLVLGLGVWFSVGGLDVCIFSQTFPNPAQLQLIAPTAATSVDESNNDPSTEPVYCNPTSSSTRCVELSLPVRANPNSNDMRFSTLSDCSSYYGLPDSPNENQSRYFSCYWSSNVCLFLGTYSKTLISEQTAGRFWSYLSGTNLKILVLFLDRSH